MTGLAAENRTGFRHRFIVFGRVGSRAAAAMGVSRKQSTPREPCLAMDASHHRHGCQEGLVRGDWLDKGQDVPVRRGARAQHPTDGQWAMAGQKDG